MTVLSGRAGSGVRQLARTLLGGVFVALGLIAGGCGNNTFTYGTAVITLSTTPGPFTAYVVAIDQIALTRSDNTVVYPLTSASGLPQIVDMTRYVDRSEIYGAPAVLEGTYVSATITLDYTSSQIFTNVNGANKKVTANDANATSPTTTALGQLSYTVKFDPAHPLVIKRGVSAPLDFNFDLSASSVLDPVALQLLARPVLTASTQPVYTPTLHSRGVFVTADVNNSNFTVNSRGFFDTYSNPTGAVEVDIDANTTFNINGAVYQGTPGLRAMQTQQINTQVEAFGTLVSLNSVKPVFKATQVYAGDTSDDLNRIRVSGTVAARSGNTLTIHGAQVLTPYTPNNVGVALGVTFTDNVTVTIGPQTAVSVDGRPDIANPTSQLISVGQQLDIDGVIPAGGTTFNNALDATSGFARLKPTTVWGVLNAAAQGTSATVDLISLGGYQPEALTFTGTGSATGADANPTAYVITNNSGVDLSPVPPNTTAVRFDGLVTAFGGAPPDLTATAAVSGPNTDQLLVVDWINGGSTNPITVASDGITVDIGSANRGSAHFIQTGPAYIQTPQTTIDLTNPQVNPKIIPNPDPTVTGQFTIGNSSTTGYSVFHSYSSFQTQVSTVLNGTNKISKLVAVGKWDGANFTAKRIDIVQVP